VTISPGINFKKKKRSDSSIVKQEAACGESVIGAIFANFEESVSAFKSSASSKLGQSFLNTTVNSTVA
jgi:sphingomyelin phosphodiesterase